MNDTFFLHWYATSYNRKKAWKKYEERHSECIIMPLGELNVCETRSPFKFQYG